MRTRWFVALLLAGCGDVNRLTPLDLTPPLVAGDMATPPGQGGCHEDASTGDPTVGSWSKPN